MSDQPLKTVNQLELQRYLGTWYEIARLPMRHEPDGCSDVSAHYTLKDNGRIRVQNRCILGDQEMESIGEAIPLDPSNARLEVSFLPEGLRWIPFTKGDYWIIRVAPDYSVALVGSPDRRFLWLLARDPALDATVQQQYLDYAQLQGFELGPLIHTPHTGRRTA